MEHDLSKICQAIPCSGLDVSTQAKNILKNLTGEDLDFDIVGNAVQLYSPIVSNHVNSITADKNSTQNGSFAQLAYLYVTIDGQVYEMPGGVYSVRAADDGKTAQITLHRNGFLPSAPVSVTCMYVDPSSSVITVTINLSPTHSGGTLVRFGNVGLAEGRYYACGVQCGSTMNIDIAVIQDQTIYVPTNFSILWYGWPSVQNLNALFTKIGLGHDASNTAYTTNIATLGKPSGDSSLFDITVIPWSVELSLVVMNGSQVWGEVTCNDSGNSGQYLDITNSGNIHSTSSVKKWLPYIGNIKVTV